MRFFKTSIQVFVVLVLGMTIVGCSNNPQAAQAKIEKLVSEMKPQLPKMLDSETRLIDVHAEDLELVSRYQLIGFPEEESEQAEKINSIVFYIKNKVCPDIKSQLLNKGIASHYIYELESGEKILDVTLKPGGC